MIPYQRNPLPIQIPPTSTNSSTLHGTTPPRRQVPDKTHVHIHPVLSLSQRNSLPIQIPPTYRHSCHPTRDHSSQETGTRQDPCPHVPELIPSSSKIRSLAYYSRLALYQRNPLPNSNPSHLQSLLSPYRGPLLPRDRYKTRPRFTCTQTDPLEF